MGWLIERDPSSHEHAYLNCLDASEIGLLGPTRNSAVIVQEDACRDIGRLSDSFTTTTTLASLVAFMQSNFTKRQSMSMPRASRK